MNHDESYKKRPLSEIGHLFLSSVRQKQTNGSPRPQRTPPAPLPAPPPPNVSIDMTPDEFAQAFAPPPAGMKSSPQPQISALIGAHLNGKQSDRARDLARYLAAHGQRVAMIEVDAAEFRLMCFEPAGAESVEDAEPMDVFDARQMSEALEELNWDVDQWLVLVPAPRTLEARELLRQVDHWVLMSTCDHDGIVGAYRTLKGLAEVNHPRLSLALLDAPDPQQAQRVYAKLASVCQQFLGWTLEEQIRVEEAPEAGENLVMCCRSRPSTSMQGPHWQVVGDFLAKAKQASGEAVEAAQEDSASVEGSGFAVQGSEGAEEEMAQPVEGASFDIAQEEPMVQMNIAANSDGLTMDAPTTQAPVSHAAAGEVAEVIDLPRLDASAATILDAVLRRNGNELVECNLRPPMCPEARLAVTRDRRIVLLAVANQGLAELRAIGQAYRWLLENRSLIGMALPQMAIDAHALPGLRLLVDQADLRADALQPMLAAGQVSVQGYRRIRWGERAGLLVDAA